MERIAGFDWDDANRGKYEKHGVTVGEIEALFSGQLRIAPDPKHSALEDRLIAVGRNAIGRAMFVAFTLRERQGRIFLRPISARYMHGKEVAAYEKKSPEA